MELCSLGSREKKKLLPWVRVGISPAECAQGEINVSPEATGRLQKLQMS